MAMAIYSTQQTITYTNSRLHDDDKMTSKDADDIVEMEIMISKVLQKQFDIYQRNIDLDGAHGVDDDVKDDSGNSDTAKSSSMEGALKHAKSIHKQLMMTTLNNAMNDMSLKKGNESSGDDDGSNENNIEVVMSLLTQYIDSTISIDVSASSSSTSTNDEDNNDDSLLPDEKQLIVSRVMDLIAAMYAITLIQNSSNIDIDDFDDVVLERIIHYSTVILERVRINACQLLGKVAYALYLVVKKNKQGGGRNGLEVISNRIKDSIVSRLTDKSQMVRNTALDASSYVVVAGLSLGDDNESESEDDNVLLESIVWNLWHDPSASNRIMAITTLSRCLSMMGGKDESSSETKNMIVDQIITRIRDVKDKVRVRAIQVIVQNKALIVSNLSVEQRCEIIRLGLVFSRYVCLLVNRLCHCFCFLVPTLLLFDCCFCDSSTQKSIFSFFHTVVNKQRMKRPSYFVQNG